MEQEWEQINEVLWKCPYKFPAGVARSLLVKLSEKQFFVYSPGDEKTAELAKAILPKDVELFLLAPNSYHNLGLAKWKTAFPHSTPVAAIAAADRIEKKTGIRPNSLDALKSNLPQHISLLELPHNKVGEVWLDIQMPGERIWAICDAVFNFSTLPGGFMGILMRLNRMGPGIEMSRVYQCLGTSNRQECGNWLLNELDQKKPTTLIPLHGQIYRKPDLVEKLETLAQNRLLK